MRIAITGATGFLGRYIVNQLAAEGHRLRCWYRPSSDQGGFEAAAGSVEWVPGELRDPSANGPLLQDCDAIVHSALYRPGAGFIGSEGELSKFFDRNVLGTLRLIEDARALGVERFVFLSTCAVHDVILADRPLDEMHPLWPKSHYGAHKAAIEAFVHSFGLGEGYAICALRPTGIYGLARPLWRSKWYELVSAVARGDEVVCRRGGKEVHAADVAKAVAVLLGTPPDRLAGQSFNCYDRYVSDHNVATIAKAIAGSASRIVGEPIQPKHQICTDKLRALGMEYGGVPLLERTIGQMIAAL